MGDSKILLEEKTIYHQWLVHSPCFACWIINFSNKIHWVPMQIMGHNPQMSWFSCLKLPFLYWFDVFNIYPRNAATPHRVDEGFGCSDEGELRQQPQNAQRGDLLLTYETWRNDAKCTTHIGGSFNDLWFNLYGILCIPKGTFAEHELCYQMIKLCSIGDFQVFLILIEKTSCCGSFRKSTTKYQGPNEATPV